MDIIESNYFYVKVQVVSGYNHRTKTLRFKLRDNAEKCIKEIQYSGKYKKEFYIRGNLEIRLGEYDNLIKLHFED